MERNPTSQNVRRHTQLKTDLDREKQAQTQLSWKRKQHPSIWRGTPQNSGSWQSHYMETTQSGAEQHCTPQMELSQERWQQTSLPEFLKKRAQPHSQLTESKMPGPRHRLCSKTQLLLALTHAWPNAWPSELEALKKMKQKKALGPNGITNEMLKHLRPRAKHLLLRIYNQSWLTGAVPPIWKEALIRPIPKKGKDRQDPSTYCLISLLSCVEKLLERIINKRPENRASSTSWRTYKRKCWSSRSRSRKAWGTHNKCHGHHGKPCRSQNWNSRLCSKGNKGSRIAQSAHTGDGAGLLSQEHLDPCLHRWLCGERC